MKKPSTEEQVGVADRDTGLRVDALRVVGFRRPTIAKLLDVSTFTFFGVAKQEANECKVTKARW